MDKLNSGVTFPRLSLKTASDNNLVLPDGLETPLTIVLFYRGYWWPFCRRLLKGYEERREALKEQGVSVIAASVDDESKTSEVAAELGFPVAWGVSREDGEKIGAWWEPVRNCMQPSEFVLRKNGKVLFSNYSNSPVGRMDPEETLVLIKYLNKKRGK